MADDGLADKDATAWSEDRMACVATYNVLEADKFMNEFEDADIAFSDASDVLLSDLRYWPKTTKNDMILKLAASEAAKKFWYLIVKHYTVKKEDPATPSYKMLDSIEKDFASSESTIGSLANTVDELLKFSNE